MNYESADTSYLFGIFCAMLQQMSQVSQPDYDKRGFDWASDAILLFRTNPESTLQLIDETLRKLPEEMTKNNGVYLLSDLIQLYQHLDFQNFIKSDVNEEQFILGYRSKIFDVEDKTPVEQLDTMEVLEKYADDPSFLFGILVAKVQFMDEGSDKSVERKGDNFIESVFSLLAVNAESTIQLIDIIIKKLPPYAEISGVIITLQEILLLYGFLGKKKLLELEFDQKLTYMGYQHELQRLENTADLLY